VIAIAATAGLAVLLPAQMINAPLVAARARPGACAGSANSTANPPDYIRVLRNHSGNVDRVPFRNYVVTVMGKEWPGYLPRAVIEAGAVAVKQFAWFHALGSGRMSRKGQCFDVTDGVGDQLYKPNRARVRQDHYQAVSATWSVRLLKHGSLFMTGYRTGNKGRCGHDRTGWKLYARSAIRCAQSGKSFIDILRIYYGPVAVVNGGGGKPTRGQTTDSTATSSTAADDAVTIDTTAPPATDAVAPAQTSVTEGGLPGAVTIDADVRPTTSTPIGERAFTAA
jgi:hypothetical protein